MKIIKKIIMAVIAVFLIGCTPTTDPEPQQTEVPATYEIAGQTYYSTGVIQNKNGNVSVWFGKDHSFVLNEKIESGNEEISGEWSVSENVITLSVKEQKQGDYTTIRFEIADETSIVLKTELNKAEYDELFVIKEKLPVMAETIPEDDSEGTPSNALTDVAGYYENITTVKGVNGQTSYLQLNADKTFELNEIEGMGAFKIEGLYGIEGNVIMFSNFKEKFYDRNGDEIYNFEMMVQDDMTLQLNEDLNPSLKGDFFSKTESVEQEAADYSGVWIREYDANVLPQYSPKVEFFKDGTFAFTENCYDAMRMIYGTYKRTQFGYECTVTDNKQMTGYKGGDVSEIFFEASGIRGIELRTELCMSQAGDMFIIEGEQ